MPIIGASELTPYSTQQQQAAVAQQAQTEADFAAQSSPLRLRQLELANAATEANTGYTQAATVRSQLGAVSDKLTNATQEDTTAGAHTEYRRQQIRRAMASVDPGDHAAWDRAMQQLVDDGNTDAAQYIGHYSLENHERLASEFSQPSDNPAATFAAGATSGQAPPVSPQQAAINYEQIRGLDLEHVNTAMESLGPIMAGARSVLDSSTPAAEMRRQAAILGHPEFANITSDLEARRIATQLRDAEEGLQQALSARQIELRSGVPNRPIPNAQVVTTQAGDTIGVNTSTPTGPQGTGVIAPAPPPPQQYLGTDDQGHAIWGNPRTATTSANTTGPTLAHGRYLGGSGSGQSVWAQRRDAAINDLHMTPAEADRWASNPRGSHPEMIVHMAQTNATAARTALVNSGETDPTALQAAYDAAYARSFQELSQAAPPDPVAGPAPTVAPPTARPPAAGPPPSAFPAALISHLRPGGGTIFNTPRGREIWALGPNGQPQYIGRAPNAPAR